MKKILIILFLLLHCVAYGQTHNGRGDSTTIDSFRGTTYARQNIAPLTPYINPFFSGKNSWYIDSTGHVWYYTGSVWNLTVGSGGGGNTYYAGTGLGLNLYTFYTDTTVVLTRTSALATYLTIASAAVYYDSIARVNDSLAALRLFMANTYFPTLDTAYLFRKPDSNTYGHAVTLTYYYAHLPSIITYTAGRGLGLTGGNVFYADSSIVVYAIDSNVNKGYCSWFYANTHFGTGNGTVTNVIGGTNISITGTSTVQPTVNLSGTVGLANGGTNATTTTSVNGTPITYGINNTLSIGVTSVTANPLSPLFTVSVSNSTTTPVISYTANSESAHTFYGVTGTANGTPAFSQVNYSDLAGSAPAMTLTVNTTAMTTGNAYTITASANTLTSTTLNPTVVTSSLTSLGSLLGLNIADGNNIVFGTSTGTKIGTSTSQKIGFYNATPIVQPTGSVITALQNLGILSSGTINYTELSGTMPTTTLTVNGTAMTTTNSYTITAVPTSPYQVQTVTVNAPSSPYVPTSNQGNVNAPYMLIITGLNTALTFSAVTGSWVTGQPFYFIITDAGTGEALTFNSNYHYTTALPTTTTASKPMVIQGVYISASSALITGWGNSN